MTRTEQQTLDKRFEHLMSYTWQTRGGEVNLLRRGWTFGYNTRKTAFGVCRPSARRIELSTPFVEVSDFDRMLDTILHEIAHALEYEVYGTAGHGHRWVEMCRITGAEPNPSHGGPAPVGRYEAYCPTHGVVTYFYRRPTRGKVCAKCRSRIEIRDTKC